jgi:O-antigen ligase
MSTQSYRSPRIFAEWPALRLIALFLFATGGVVVAAPLIQVGDYRSALVVVTLSLSAGVIVYTPVSIQSVLVFWFATTPLLSYYLRFPIDRSILTYDRVIFISIVVALLLRRREKAPGQPYRFALSRSEIAWALLALMAGASAVTRADNVPYATRLAVDTFLLPLVAFHVARNYFDLPHAGRSFLLASIPVALFLFISGAIELATGDNLFAINAAQIIREGERRVNGPFATDSSFAVICLMLFTFLLAAPRMFRVCLDRVARLIYSISLIAAALGALLPLFRMVAIALALCGIFLIWSTSATGRARKRSFVVGVVAAVMLLAVGGVVATLASSATRNRLISPRTAFGRLATWEAAAEITIENPIVGVGLGNYPAYFDASHYYSDQAPEEVGDTKAVDSPHSTPLWISSELGLVGLALFLAAHVYLLMNGWRAMKNAADRFQQATAACFLALLAAYWIPGLTLTSGYYSDANLCFFFLAGVLSSGFVRPLPNHRSTVSDFTD